MFTHIQVLEVWLWNQRVGVLALNSAGEVVFEYDPIFRKRGVEIAPFTMPLSQAIYTRNDFDLPRNAFSGLPGVFADSLPDSFGNRLVRKWMEEHGMDVRSITPLDRLAYVGKRGMGALTYEPSLQSKVTHPVALDMRRLVEEARLALNANLSNLNGDDALREIIRVGTSAGGAQAKAVVAWKRGEEVFLAGDEDIPDDYEAWMIKFSPYGVSDAGNKEWEVYQKACACGIIMSESRLYELDGVKHFMTKRFDRVQSKRHHLQTYAAMRHLPPTSPSVLRTYEGIFDTIVGLNMGYEVLEQMFRRMAFNVVLGECDDHTKNFAFLLTEGGDWQLAPAYDLTAAHFSAADDVFNDWSNQHALSVNGKFSAIRDEDLLKVAERYGLGTAKRILSEIHSILGK